MHEDGFKVLTMTKLFALSFSKPLKVAAAIDVSRYLCFVFLVDAPNLLPNVHSLHPLHFFALIQLPVIAQSCLLPPRSFLFADDWLASHAIEDITALRSEALEVGLYIGS